ncbi:acyl carrier protein [Paenibacillus tyrfis]|uniref:acyl carrier protein n=1 Tax=Paenibacillus tyrfis TaxID=1501230 RepID=UPI00209FDB02|nr:acyl carrier protein [Paenibacillus tyrfis]MCP1311562.1 acyl carrier protein [Paenibacillus tyrfis]
MMTKSEIKSLIEGILDGVLEQNNQQYDLDQELGQLGLDSMKSVALVIDLEEQFDIIFEDEELLVENFSSLQKIIEIVECKLTGAK